VLTKDQALASMDVHLIRQAADRKRRLERRVSRLSIAYPALRKVPLEARLDLAEAAYKYARRQWTTYALMAPVIGALASLIVFEPMRDIAPSLNAPAPVLVLLSFALCRFVVYLHVRPYLDGIVASAERRESRLDDADT
jgi:hypothetical protein